jgi:hypothetical protein
VGIRAVAVAIAAISGCGRANFDERIVGPDSAVACRDGDPCDDGDPCTGPDVCKLGTCTGGPVLASCAAAPRVIDRSVGVSAGNALAASTGALTVIGTTAIFAQPVPDNVGIGDVIQYATDGTTPDALAFIHARISSTVYSVRDKDGGTPSPTVQPAAAWSIFRAYLSLAAAVNIVSRSPHMGGTENPNIDASLRDFDPFTGGKDLVAANERWNVACYDDGAEDDELVYLDAPWITDPDHIIHIFTPTAPTEVGVSQRHTGKWGTGYRRTQALQIWERSAWVDGLSMRQTRVLNDASDPDADNRTFFVSTGGQGSVVKISNCFGWMAQPASWDRVFDTYENYTPAGTLTTTVAMWNNVGITDSNMGISAAFYPNSLGNVYFYNCTGIATDAAAGFRDGFLAGATATIVNALGYSQTGGAFQTDNGPMRIANSASNDGSILSTGIDSTTTASNLANATYTFVDSAGTDYHLTTGAGDNAGVRGAGMNLMNNPVVPFDDDLDGQARPQPPTAWDIGADQVP